MSDRDEEVEQEIATLRTWLSGPFGEAVRQLDSQDIKTQTAQRDRPVRGAKDCLIRGFKLYTEGKVNAALMEVRMAANMSLDGVGYPDAADDENRDRTAARGAACLWRGISCGILGSIEPQLISWDPMSCDMWFGQAAYIYLNLERGIEVARVLAEWSEARAFVGDSSSSQSFGRLAEIIYMKEDDFQGAVAVANKLAYPGPSRWDSAMLLGRSPNTDEECMLRTVLGGRNTYAFREALLRA